MNFKLIIGWITWVITLLFNTYLAYYTSELMGIIWIIVFGSSACILLMAIQYLRGVEKCQIKK